ncbi:MAG: hypothetical protein DRJ50_09010 [Actinobacteria bacterium]|nr:MAG: hypothetical protein DRJ50_09010 [Actinomycetota bacterium]
MILHANHLVPSDRLLEVSWGDGAADGGVGKLRFQVPRLRDALDPGRDVDESSVNVASLTPGLYTSKRDLSNTAPVHVVPLSRALPDAVLSGIAATRTAS